MPENTAMKYIVYILILLFGLSISYAQDRELVLVKSFPDETSEKKGDFLAHPFEVEIYNGQYYVTDADDGCIKVFDREGAFVRQIGRKGTGPGELFDPYCFTVDHATGEIYCQDQGSARIAVFNPDGTYKLGILPVSGLHDIIIYNNLVITSQFSTTGPNFKVYDRSGKLISEFGVLNDDKISKLLYARYIYGDVVFSVMDDTLYVLYQDLPIIQVYSVGGIYYREIPVKDKAIQSVYEHNINPNKVLKKNNRFELRKWFFSALSSDGFFYAHQSTGDSDIIYVIDRNGRIQNRFYIRKESSYFLRLGAIQNGDFVFTDIFNAKIKVYRERE